MPRASLNYNISSAAVADCWAGRSRLLSIANMRHEAMCHIDATGELVSTDLHNYRDWCRWCNETMGIGLVKRKGWEID